MTRILVLSSYYKLAFIFLSSLISHAKGVEEGSTTDSSKFASKLSPYHNDNDGNDLGSSFPRLTYGTAWKKDATANLVYHAIYAGFRHVDTACQPKHYNEAGVGEGWTAAAKELNLDRSDVWLQTKYTSVSGQDPKRIPYNPEASLREQVHESLKLSLRNLQTAYLDSWVMHGPESTWEANFEIWHAMEEMVDAGLVRQIGISNFYDPGAVEWLYNHARIKPAVVQNRFYGDTGYDVQIRQFCLNHGMEYQSFWTLGANRHFLQDRRVLRLAEKRNLSPETILYAIAMKLGITPLDGTTSIEHMQDDVALVRRLRKGGEEIISDTELKILVKVLGIPKSSPVEGEENAEEDEDEDEEL